MSEFLKKRNIFKYINIGALIIPIIVLITPPFAKNIYRSSLWFSMILCLGFISLFSSFYHIYHSKKNEKINKKDFLPLILLSIFLIWTLITCLINGDIITTIFGDEYRKEGFITYIAYAGFLIDGILTKKKDRNIYFKILVIITTILSLLTMFKCSFTNFFLSESSEYQAIFHQFNHFGYLLLMSIVCNINLIINCNNKKERLFYFITFLITSFTLMLNNTLGSYLAVLGGMFFLLIYYFFIKKEKLIILSIIICIFVGISFIPVRKNDKGMAIQLYSNITDVFKINYNNLSNKTEQQKVNALGTTRGYLWRQAINLIKKKPITGYGLDNIRKKMYGNDRPHNMVIQMAAYTGIPGMLLYVSSIILIVFRTLKTIRNIDSTIITSISVVIAYIVSSITSNSMYYTSLYYMIFLGFCINNLLKLRSIEN